MNPLELISPAGQPVDSLTLVDIAVKLARLTRTSSLTDIHESVTEQPVDSEILQRLELLRTLAADEGDAESFTPLHKTADKHVKDLALSIRVAFAAARKAIKTIDFGDLEDVLPEILKAELEKILPTTLARVAVAGAETALALRDLGGKGSGNFGHAGRPGQVGGSAAEEYPEGLVKVSGPKGSNPGGVFRDKDGKKWYVKQYKNADQAAGEHIANAIYTRIGVAAADSRLSADGKTIALLWRDGQVLNQHGLDSDTANRVLDGFAADVFLQNWDAVGTGHDNVLVRPDGSVMRIDQGGTLLHRAQGALKPETGRHEIGEWESLQTFNPYYAEVFKKAGVASADALGERAAQQIDRIVHGRPEGGWGVLVSKVAPLASPSYKKAVSGMLEARQGLLEKKRDSLRMKTLGGPGSGHFGHKGRPGKVGGSSDDDHGASDADVTIVKKAKAPPATKKQIATAVQMKAEGKSYAEIQEKTGLNPKQAATIVHKHKKAQAAALGVLTEKAKPQQKVEPWPNKFTTVAAAKGYTFKQITEGPNEGKWAFVNQHDLIVSMMVPGASASQMEQAASTIYAVQKQLEPDASKAAELVEKAIDKLEAQNADSDAAAASVIAAPAVENILKPTGEHTLDTLKQKGFEWQEKTFGPEKGMYAFFKNGSQVSGFGPKEDWKTAVPTINFNKGPDYVAPKPPPTPGVIGDSGLYADVVGKAETLTPWPIADNIARTLGAKTPGIVYDKGQNWVSKLSLDEKEAVRSYTDIGSSAINSALRHGKNNTKANKIQAALAKADPPPPPDLVWRGVSSVDPHKFISSLETGDVIRLKSFQSTSINPDMGAHWASGKTLFEIRPKRGAYVKSISQHPHEYEFLLPHGAKYVVRGAKKVKFGFSSADRFVIQLEMVDD